MQTLASFNNGNGVLPGPLSADASGDLFGTAGDGGANNDGTAFEITGAEFKTVAVLGTQSGQVTTSETPVTLFSGVTISEVTAGATETLTIGLSGAGGGFNGLTENSTGAYTLSGTAAAVTTELDALVFTPTKRAPNTAQTTYFNLNDTNSAGASASDGTTAVTDADPAVAPTISGAPADPTVTSKASSNPFAALTITDPNGGVTTETLTIAFNTATGALGGVTGLTAVTRGYAVTDTLANLNADLAALTLPPAVGARTRLRRPPCNLVFADCDRFPSAVTDGRPTPPRDAKPEEKPAPPSVVSSSPNSRGGRRASPFVQGWDKMEVIVALPTFANFNQLFAATSDDGSGGALITWGLARR